MKYPGVVFFVISCMFLFVVAAYTLTAQNAHRPETRAHDSQILFGVALPLWGASLVPVAVVLILRRVLARRYDPNAADVERRIDLGRYRAVTKEDYQRGVLPRDANPDTRDGNPRNG
jgi:hypothetical protein